jgi:hypothetical protein
VVALSRADTGLRAQVEPLRRLGESEAARLLGVQPLPSVAWPPPGPLPAALDVVVGGQSRAVVLDASALPPVSGSRNRTPSARSELPSLTGPVSGLVVEPVLSALLEPTGGQGLPASAGGEALRGEEASPGGGGRLASSAGSPRPRSSRPSAERLPHPARRAPPAGRRGPGGGRRRHRRHRPAAVAVRGAAGRRGRRDRALRRAARRAGPGGPGAVGRQPATEGGPPGGGGPGLSPAFLDRLAQVTQESEQFTEAVLVPGSEQAAATRARLLRATGRAASAAWREQPLQGREMLRLLQEDVAAMRSKVRLVSGPITLTGSSGTLPLLVQNELDQPVTVGVVLDQTSAARLSLSASGAQVVPPRELYERISVQVEPRTSGRFVVLATLVDAQGRRFGDAVPLQVRSTGYGGLALTVTGWRRRCCCWPPAPAWCAGCGTGPARTRRPPRDGSGPLDPAMAVGTIASRGTGLLRNVVLAAVLGLETVGAAYTVANTAPTSSTSCCWAGCSPPWWCRCWCAPPRRTATRARRTRSGCSPWSSSCSGAPRCCWCWPPRGSSTSTPTTSAPRAASWRRCSPGTSCRRCSSTGSGRSSARC